MTPQQMKLGLAVTAIFIGSVAANLLVLQPGTETSARPARAYRGLDHLPGISSRPPLTGKARVSATTAASSSTDGGSGVAAAIGPQAPTPATADDPASVVRYVQQALAARGYMPGGVDGIQGIVTQAAIMAFEHDQGLPLTGQASLSLIANLEAGSTPRPRASITVPPTAEAESIIRTVQQSLERMGYRPGPNDGRVGAATSAAIRGFERDNNLPETGRVSGILLVHLAGQAEKGRLAAR